MNHNPFLSKLFVKKWIKHFNYGNEGVSFSFFPNITFIKQSYLPIYTNVGKTNTKGFYYKLSQDLTNDYKGKVFLLYDVPKYFDIKNESRLASLKSYRIRQYSGYLCQLNGFVSLEDYMTATISKKSRYKFNLYLKKIETCFNIDYKMFHGAISKEEYNLIFDRFRELLEKRFKEKKINNNNLDPQEWNFYKDVSYSMLLKKKAALFVTYHQESPIAISLLYFSKNIVFDTIRTFDIDFSKFRLGTLSLMKQIEWCISNNVGILDFSKGHFEYKERWTNTKYPYEYHLFYDSKNLAAVFLAVIIKNYFVLKQGLRELHVNDFFYKLMFKLKHIKNKANCKTEFFFIEPQEDYSPERLAPIDITEGENEFLKKYLYDFLYKTNEKIKWVRVYKIKDIPHSYIFKGINSSFEIHLAANK